MKSTEKTIRDAAAALLDAINKGKSAGLVVAWPSKAEDLAIIAISETAKAAPVAPKGPEGGSIS